MQIYRSCATAVYSFDLPRHPLGPATLDNSSSLSTDAYRKTYSHILRMQILARITALQTRVNNRVKLVQEQNKRDYDTKVNSMQTFWQIQIDYNATPPLAIASTGSSRGPETSSYKKQLTKAIGLFPAVSVQQNTPINGEHRIHNKVAIDRATIRPGDNPLTYAFQRFAVEKIPGPNNCSSSHSTQPAPVDYPVDQIVEHNGLETEIFLRACWYVYSPHKENLEPAKHVLQQFIHRY